MAAATNDSNTPQLAAAPTGPMQKGWVKLVLSGDTLTIRGQPRGGPPPEKTISLSGINAPRMGKRPTEASGDEQKDEPYAWEARERLRSALVGKEVVFSLDYKVPSGREFCRVYLPSSEPGADGPGENMAETLVAEGLVEVRVGQKGFDEYTAKLDAAQQNAKVQKKGRWGDGASGHVRDITWTVDNIRHLVDSLKQRPQKAIIEHVRDGSTVRAFLIPSFQYVTVMMSGVKCPIYRMGTGGEVIESEPFAEEAKYFTESRLLQREVDIILESVSNQNLIGSILHPNGNLAELLLREGLAKCVDWSIALVSGGPEKYRAAEKLAKERRLRLWRNYTPAAVVSGGAGSASQFNAKVVEIGLGDSLTVIKDGQTQSMKIHLSSIRAPKTGDGPAGSENKENAPIGRQFRPLYDIPFMFEAREFLRKRLIGKKVQVTVDYKQAASDQYAEKLCCTVIVGGVNVAEGLVAKGLATCVRYRQDDDNRSPAYDALLAAEAKAEKDKLKIHALRAGVALDKSALMRVQDLSGDAQKSKTFLPYLQRAGRCEAVVEFVASGSRLRLFVPKETCLMTLLLAGISCPRGARQAPGPGGAMLPAEKYGDEANEFVRSRCLQHECHVEVESMDKAGNMIGWLFIDGENLSESLVRHGLAQVHFSAERSKYYTVLSNAETQAKQKKLNLWTNYEEVDEVAVAEQAAVADAAQVSRHTNYRRVIITECAPFEKHIRLAVQSVDDGARLEQLMSDLRVELSTHVPVKGAYKPRRNELCAAQFAADRQWYRAKVEMINAAARTVDVLYIDFGNRETVSAAECLAALPPQYAHMSPGAKEYALAFVGLKDDVDDARAACETVLRMSSECDVGLNVEYRAPPMEFASLKQMKPPAGAGSSTATDADNDWSSDIGYALIKDGFALVESRRERRFDEITSAYKSAEAEAKRKRLNIWQYGDFTGDTL